MAGTIRFGVGAVVGSLLSLVAAKSAWPMVTSMVLCTLISLLFYLHATRLAKAAKAA